MIFTISSVWVWLAAPSFRTTNCILFYPALSLPCCPTCNVLAVINRVCCYRQPLYSVIKAILRWSKRWMISEDGPKALKSFLLWSPKRIPFELPVLSVDVEWFEKAQLPAITQREDVPIRQLMKERHCSVLDLQHSDVRSYQAQRSGNAALQIF